MQSPILSGTNFQVGGITDLEGQLVRAAEVQRSLLPRRHRRFSGWEVGYTYEPAEFVSGDYVDLIPARDGGFYFVLGDVSGKGIPASILMSHLHATLRAFLRMDLPLSEVLERTSQIFCEITLPAQFATLVVGRAASDGTLDICNAGHVPVVLVGGDGIRKLSSSGPPVGVFCKTNLHLSFKSTPQLMTFSSCTPTDYRRHRIKLVAARRTEDRAFALRHARRKSSHSS